MERDEIRARLGRATIDKKRGEDCLPPEQLAGFIDGRLGSDVRATAEAHLADCDHCLQQLSAICHSEDENPAAVPGELTERALNLGAERPRSRHWPRWAAAAVVVLAVAMVFQLQQTRPMNTSSATDDYRETRFAERAVSGPRLLAPAEGAAIRPLDQVFRWSEVPGSLWYDVRLVDPNGDLLLRERVEGTRWLIPERVGLKPGEEYFVRVDAYLDEARYLSSEHVVFRIQSGK